MSTCGGHGRAVHHGLVARAAGHAAHRVGETGRRSRARRAARGSCRRRPARPSPRASRARGRGCRRPSACARCGPDRWRWRWRCRAFSSVRRAYTRRPRRTGRRRAPVSRAGRPAPTAPRAGAARARRRARCAAPGPSRPGGSRRRPPATSPGARRPNIPCATREPCLRSARRASRSVVRQPGRLEAGAVPELEAPSPEGQPVAWKLVDHVAEGQSFDDRHRTDEGSRRAPARATPRSAARSSGQRRSTPCPGRPISRWMTWLYGLMPAWRAPVGARAPSGPRRSRWRPPASPRSARDHRRPAPAATPVGSRRARALLPRRLVLLVLRARATATDDRHGWRALAGRGHALADRHGGRDVRRPARGDIGVVGAADPLWLAFYPLAPPRRRPPHPRHAAPRRRSVRFDGLIGCCPSAPLGWLLVVDPIVVHAPDHAPRDRRQQRST